jgi:hypothetical protein
MNTFAPRKRKMFSYIIAMMHDDNNLLDKMFGREFSELEWMYTKVAFETGRGREYHIRTLMGPQDITNWVMGINGKLESKNRDERLIFHQD